MQTLDEVVVVGFGTQKKVNLTGAVATVDKKDAFMSCHFSFTSSSRSDALLNIDMNDKGGRSDETPR